MSNEELITQMKKVRNNLENAKTQLRNAKNILNESITFQNEGLKSENIDSLNTRLSTQINIINNKIITKLNDM